MDIKDINKLLASVSEADISELTLETGDYKLVVKRGQETVIMQAPAQTALQAPPMQQIIQEQPQQITQLPPVTEQVAPSQEVETATEASTGVVLTEITAPIVGTFYSAASPDTPPFVKEGESLWYHCRDSCA